MWATKYTIFLKFSGGKGVATSAGVLLGVFPYYTIPGLIAIGIWIILFKATRYVSVASIFGIGVALATKFGRREPWFLAWRPAEA